MSCTGKFFFTNGVLALVLFAVLGVTNAIASQSVIKDCEQCPEMIIVPVQDIRFLRLNFFSRGESHKGQR